MSKPSEPSIQLTDPEALSRFREIATVVVSSHGGMTDAALQALQAKAVELRVHPVDMKSLMAEAAADPIGAEPFYREAVRLQPVNATYQGNVGNALLGQRKDAEAEPFYREAVRLQPTYAGYQVNLGRALYWQKKYAEAEPFYREAVRLEPTNDAYRTELFDCTKHVPRGCW